MIKNYNLNKKRQQGVALAIGMILLLVIAVIGIHSMKSALLQEKMAGGLANLAAAETASYSVLVSVENHLNVISQTNNGLRGESCDICEDNPSEAMRPSDPSVQGSYRYFKSKKDLSIGRIFAGSIATIKASLNLAADPVYLAYYLSDGGVNLGDDYTIELDNFVIVAKSTDPTGNIFVVSESVYTTVRN